jgi:hypothetical protein
MILWNPRLAAHVAEQRVAPRIPTAHRTSPHISSRGMDYNPDLANDATFSASCSHVRFQGFGRNYSFPPQQKK